MAVTVKIRQFWIKPWSNGNNAVIQNGGSDTFTPAQGATLVCLQTGWDTLRQVPMPSISPEGQLTIPANGAQHTTDAGVGFWTEVGYLANVSAVPHKVYPSYITDGVGGSNGEQNIWILEINGMPNAISVRNCVNVVAASSTQSVTLTSGSTPQVGDICLAIFMEENSAAIVSAAISDPPSGWTSIGVNNDATNNLPTEACYKIVSSSGAQSATWTLTDAGKTYHCAVMLTLQTSGASMTFTTLPQATSTTSGGFATFSCAVSGASGTAHYQWYVNGAAVGQDSSTLIYKPATTETTSTVNVTVTDNLGSIYSTPVNLQVFRN